jgi:hypothetical protein
VLLVTLLLKNVSRVLATELILLIVYVQPVLSIPKLKNQSVILVLKDVLLVLLVKLVLLVLTEELMLHIAIVLLDNLLIVDSLLNIIVMHHVQLNLVGHVTILVKHVLTL